MTTSVPRGSRQPVHGRACLRCRLPNGLVSMIIETTRLKLGKNPVASRHGRRFAAPHGVDLFPQHMPERVLELDDCPGVRGTARCVSKRVERLLDCAIALQPAAPGIAHDIFQIRASVTAGAYHLLDQRGMHETCAQVPRNVGMREIADAEKDDENCERAGQASVHDRARPYRPPTARAMAASAVATTTSSGGARQTVSSTNPATAIAKSAGPVTAPVQTGS